jgi:RES domain-containing protein
MLPNPSPTSGVMTRKRFSSRPSRRFGDRWYNEQRTTVLIVPSAVLHAERNFVIHQEHPGFRKLRASRPKPVVWDERLFR